ncbi:MAG: hypothetical protein RBR71_03695 [Gudongella sp.]|nr:hypothetical protein [Gudongella sp.]
MEDKRLITKNVEEELTDLILEQVIKHQMTISNFQDVSYEVIKYLEDNATAGVRCVDLSDKKDITHIGIVKVKGVDNEGDLKNVVDIVMDQLRREVRNTDNL